MCTLLNCVLTLRTLCPEKPRARLPACTHFAGDRGGLWVSFLVDQVQQLEACVLGGFWASRRVLGPQAARRNSRGSAARDYPVAAVLPDLPSRRTEMTADTLLAALGRAQGGSHKRLYWLLLRGVGRGKKRGCGAA